MNNQLTMFNVNEFNVNQPKVERKKPKLNEWHFHCWDRYGIYTENKTLFAKSYKDFLNKFKTKYPKYRLKAVFLNGKCYFNVNN